MPSPDVPFLRTKDDRFQDVPDFPYEPHYLQYGNLRMAYIDEKEGKGDSAKETFLCLHGQPTWSYLYRKMIPIFLRYTTREVPLSRRVIAPDLLGFGRSDKPKDEAVYNFDFHRDAILHLIRTLDLTNITLVVQDWGGLIGLTLPLDEPHRYKRLVVMNTTIAIGQPISQGFLDWRAFCNRSPDLKVGALLRRSCENLSMQEAEGYDAPFLDKQYKAGLRRFPNMVMIEESMPGVDLSRKSLAWYQTTDHFQAEDIFMACGSKDVVFGTKVMGDLAREWKNGCYFTDIFEAGHFVQEWGDQVAISAIQTFEAEGTGSRPEGVRRIEPANGKL